MGEGKSQLTQCKGLLYKSWWALLFCGACVGLYVTASQEKGALLEELSFRLQEMEKEKLIAAAEQSDLELRLRSENDPAWIEMVLMKELGVVPEGWIKIQFK